MGVLEIVLLAAGAVIFIASFCIPVKQEKLHEEAKKLAEGEVKALVSAEVEALRPRLTELSEDELQQQIEKSERSMERISNEKIMAVNEYSDTVLEEIHKNHEEVIFLYDMLKSKKEQLTESLGAADKNMKELLQQVKDSEITVQENLKQLEEKQVQTAAHLENILQQQGSGKEDARQTGAGGAGAVGVKEAWAAGTVQKAKEAGQDAEMHKTMLSGGALDSLGSSAAFKPFQPKRVDVVPKKRDAPKPPVKPETEMKASNREAESSGKNSNERILELHKAGKSNMAIAKDLGLGIGEVKLVIDLFESLHG